MELTQAQLAYLPMTESAYYILLSLCQPRHGYGIMQYVESITNDRLRLGPGTLYGSLSRMENDQLIEVIAEKDRRKVYRITDAGQLLLKKEIQRLKELIDNGLKTLDQHGIDMLEVPDEP